MSVVIVTLILPIVGTMPAQIQMLHALGIFGTIWSMWLMSASFLGLFFLIFYASFKGISSTYWEAAYVDGASELRVMVQIILPFVRNVFFTIMLIKFIGFWNDYQAPLIYMMKYPTLSFALFRFSNDTAQILNNIPVRLAGCMIMLVPLLIVFVAFHSRLSGNLTMGGIKE
jgi:ABC-type glycerol-3-phosphate transport system permease component